MLAETFSNSAHIYIYRIGLLEFFDSFQRGLMIMEYDGVVSTFVTALFINHVDFLTRRISPIGPIGPIGPIYRRFIYDCLQTRTRKFKICITYFHQATSTHHKYGLNSLIPSKRRFKLFDKPSNIGRTVAQGSPSHAKLDNW